MKKKLGSFVCAALFAVLVCSLTACGSDTKKQDQNPLAITAVTGKCVGDPAFNLQTSGGSGYGAVTYSQTSGTAVAMVNSTGLVTIVSEGDFKVKATKAADDIYKAITSAELTITISPAPPAEKQNQTALTITASTDEIRVGDTGVTLTVSGGTTGGEVTLVQMSGTNVATVSNSGEVTNIVTAGSFTVKATMAGNDDYNPVEVTTTFGVLEAVDPAKETQATLVITDPGEKTYGDGNFELSTTGGSGSGEVTFTISEGGDEIASLATASDIATVTILKAGDFKVRATKAGDDNYNSTSSAILTVKINKQDRNHTVSIIGWTVGEAANAPSVNGTVAEGAKVDYEYSKDGTSSFTKTVPTAAGIWYVRAVIEATTNYNEQITAAVQFTISSLTNPNISPTTAITITEGTPVSVTVSSMEEYLYYKFVPASSGWYNIIITNGQGSAWVNVNDSDDSRIGSSGADGTTVEFLAKDAGYYLVTGAYVSDVLTFNITITAYTGAEAIEGDVSISLNGNTKSWFIYTAAESAFYDFISPESVFSVLTVYNKNGDIIAFSGRTYEIISYTYLVEGEKYYIYTESSGDYTLNIKSKPFVDIAMGETKIEEVGFFLTPAHFQFTPSATGEYKIECEADDVVFYFYKDGDFANPIEISGGNIAEYITDTLTAGETVYFSVTCMFHSFAAVTISLNA